jgi:hypothetical protein
MVATGSRTVVTHDPGARAPGSKMGPAWMMGVPGGEGHAAEGGVLEAHAPSKQRPFRHWIAAVQDSPSAFPGDELS